MTECDSCARTAAQAQRHREGKDTEGSAEQHQGGQRLRSVVDGVESDKRRVQGFVLGDLEKLGVSVPEAHAERKAESCSIEVSDFHFK